MLAELTGTSVFCRELHSVFSAGEITFRYLSTLNDVKNFPLLLGAEESKEFIGYGKSQQKSAP